MELTPYEVFKEKGADKLIEIIEKGNFHELGESIPKRGEDKLIAEFYEKLKIGDIDYIDKNYYLNCEKELYELQEIEANELLKMVEHDNTIEMKQAEMKDYENTMGTAEGKSGFDDSMEAETKASDVQKATHDIRKINEQQQEITNGDRWR